MTLDEFYKQLKSEIITDYIVLLKYKYDFETEYTIRNEILMVDMNSDDLYAWLRDWNEGQTDVEVLGYIAVWEVDVRCGVKR